MTCTPLSERFKRRRRPEADLALWQAESTVYARRPLPDFAEDGFLKIVAASGVLDPATTLLDVGCAAGLYTLAVAPKVASAYGCDLAPAMIEAARSRARELGVANVRFEVRDWARPDEPMQTRFDVGFARMTPAVADYAGFMKFLKAVTRHGFYERAINRRHPAMALAFEIAGLAGSPLWHDDDVYMTLEMLLSSGLRPNIAYRPAAWKAAERPLRLTQFCVRRLRAAAPYLTEDDLERIHAELLKRLQADCGADGLTPCPQTATIVTLDWAM